MVSFHEGQRIARRRPTARHPLWATPRTRPGSGGQTGAYVAYSDTRSGHESR